MNIPTRITMVSTTKVQTSLLQIIMQMVFMALSMNLRTEATGCGTLRKYGMILTKMTSMISMSPMKIGTVMKNGMDPNLLQMPMQTTPMMMVRSLSILAIVFTMLLKDLH